jgi:xanthine dehydrogenase YagS FAD-binding subunit
MKPFSYVRSTSVDDAIEAFGKQRDAKFLGGGTNLIDLMKMGVEQPTHPIDVTRLPLPAIEEYRGGSASARWPAIATWPAIR